ncbi:unnamed protein product [Paramecium sonneborni]|uniref:Uncharacterized protein n=1 Tax=Paramecium sonneborni TaxID=65129 RepID=A0A8S1Q7Y6_9CILI|nr:unnamed protein product [Paramecium sonneborni]
MEINYKTFLSRLIHLNYLYVKTYEFGEYTQNQNRQGDIFESISIYWLRRKLYLRQKNIGKWIEIKLLMDNIKMIKKKVIGRFV